MAMQGAPLFPGDSEIDQIFKIFRYEYFPVIGGRKMTPMFKKDSRNSE
jgi:hypothetical protein